MAELAPAATARDPGELLFVTRYGVQLHGPPTRVAAA